MDSYATVVFELLKLKGLDVLSQRNVFCACLGDIAGTNWKHETNILRRNIDESTLELLRETAVTPESQPKIAEKRITAIFISEMGLSEGISEHLAHELVRGVCLFAGKDDAGVYTENEMRKDANALGEGLDCIDSIRESEGIPDDASKTNECKLQCAESSDTKLIFADDGIKIKAFDLACYLEQSEDSLFVEADEAFGQGDYARALSAYEKADAMGNKYALARIGLMHYYGYGCSLDKFAAFRSFKKAAENGCPLGAIWVSKCLRWGHGVNRDAKRGQEIYSYAVPELWRMVDCGDAFASGCLGYDLSTGFSTEGDHDREAEKKEGFRLLNQACKKGYAPAYVELARSYYFGRGVKQDPGKAVELLTKYPDPSDLEALHLLGLCSYYGKGTEKNLHDAFRYFKSSAELGHFNAKYMLACCYYHGYGTERDCTQAARWFKDSADNNKLYKSSCMLGLMYLKGEGVELNEKEAIRYLMYAAENGISDAQYLIAGEYFKGNSVLKQDAREARNWMEKAAKQGDSKAQRMLGLYYVSGRGFDDEAKAFEWFMKAAEQGDPEAEYIVGGSYKNGLGVAVDDEEAKKWFIRAAEHGNEKAASELDSHKPKRRLFQTIGQAFRGSVSTS